MYMERKIIEQVNVDSHSTVLYIFTLHGEPTEVLVCFLI